MEGPHGLNVISSIAKSFPLPPGELLMRTTSTALELISDLKSIEKFFHVLSSAISPELTDPIIAPEVVLI